MTPETKSEVVIVAIAGAVLLLLWARNRNAGGGTGLEGLPLLSQPGNALPGAAPLFNIPAPVPGLDVSYQGSPWALPSPFTINAPGTYNLDAGGASACNCQGGTSQSASTFGSPADLSAWLSSQPGLMASLNDIATNWD
jgi:hypothetical protein